MQDLINKIHLADSLDIMRQLPDKSIDLVLTDPPYGKIGFAGAGKLINRKLTNAREDWNILPSEEYFNEIFRISKNQIIWGGNYFDLPPTRCFIIWNKQQPWENFSQAEYAWTSFKNPSKLWTIDKCSVASSEKIHPTQKPLQLIEKCIAEFSCKDDLILDCFSGSGTTAIACIELGRRFVCIEKDPEYYAASIARLEKFNEQGRLFL